MRLNYHQEDARRYVRKKQHFVAMKISQEVRDAARGTNDSMSTAEIRAAMARKSEEFKQGGGEIYVQK